VLGKEIAEAAPEAHEVVAINLQTDEVETFTIPPYPFPYFRGKNGGVYKRMEAADKDEDSEEGQDGAEGEAVLIYPYDIYVVKRMSDPLTGGVALLRVHLPQDGVKEFALTNRVIVKPAELREELAAQDIMCNSTHFKMLSAYLLKSIQTIQVERSTEKMRLQFGWADNNSKFIVGDQEVTSEGVFHSPPSTTTEELARRLGASGSYEKWQQVFNLYGEPGLEPHAFAALTAFGAPLLKFTGQKGAIINVIHPSSGTGKTTILHMCNSVWGSPDEMCGVQDDTMNAKVMRLGVFNNLPYVVDEITNMEAKDFSNLVYNITQGRGKDRVKASANELRKNLTTWQTIALCSSNSSFYEKLTGGFKKNPDGEMMRLLEYKIDYTKSLDPEIAKQMFDHQLLQNYGHAGLIYAKWLICNLEEAKNAVKSTQLKIDRELKLSQRERFWSAVLAANIAGGLIAKQLKIIDWDMRAIYRWSLAMVNDLRKEVKPVNNSSTEILGDYLLRHINNTVVVNGTLDKRSMSELPILTPKGELYVRYEPDTKKLFVAAKHFKNDCVRQQINYKETLRDLENKGIYLGADTKRLSTGMAISITGVHSLFFDCSQAELLDIEGVILPTTTPQAETADAGGGD
jgi:hypothetical protein